jgi:hypothetical protein
MEPIADCNLLAVLYREYPWIYLVDWEEIVENVPKSLHALATSLAGIVRALPALQDGSTRLHDNASEILLAHGNTMSQMYWSSDQLMKFKKFIAAWSRRSNVQGDVDFSASQPMGTTSTLSTGAPIQAVRAGAPSSGTMAGFTLKDRMKLAAKCPANNTATGTMLWYVQ